MKSGVKMLQINKKFYCVFGSKMHVSQTACDSSAFSASSGCFNNQTENFHSHILLFVLSFSRTRIAEEATWKGILFIITTWYLLVTFIRLGGMVQYMFAHSTGIPDLQQEMQIRQTRSSSRCKIIPSAFCILLV